MPRFNPPGSTAVVDVPDDLAERYVAAGWVAVKPKRSKKTEDADSE